MLGLTIENITENVMKINSMCDNPRLRYLIMKLVKVSHDYIRDVGLHFDEWEQAWQFLTRVLLVDAISYPSVPGATESSVLGPFHDEEAHSLQYSKSIATTGTPAEPTIAQGYIKDTDGNPVSRALIDVVAANDAGHFLFLCVKSVAYPISNDGPVGELLRTLKRHWYRPAHMHFMIEHPQYSSLITALYSRDSKFVESDTVFGVKGSLIVDYH
ncbi:aromatic compound dioxygenase [Aspergillus ruber CBS 135680]|uniref:Aromatic compound dioxygenase n=1 Tax=Aspergillus ruber (strain CBS 135680) TaxID=1388766 RepID=A0A017SIB0_ASPRC|nr:aromatic compound dioxygenase [Aspergillus ruber CBS 135680]EYE96020.1 aromatic compound dioxygenase [Aspergillus ruber CBS 135680]